MNKKNLICFLLLILIVGVYYSYQKDDDVSNSPSNANQSEMPIYQSDDMVTNIYDLSGNLVYKIESGKVKHFDTNNNTDFDLPNVTLYAQDHAATWNIKAKRATLTNDKLIYLYQDVTLTNLMPDSQLQQVITDNAEVDLTTQIVTSKDPVKIRGIGFFSTGVGLVGNLREKTANILENVKTFYNSEAQ
ncbi:LPS export ABC transporter periplasmic protein LptC [Gilliamella sp. A7]|uniref:LPS export ABC transporter periplasmic protein LptC n=1 Tax=Gilliamella sp. A7 TaxID=1970465 RepID=UPI000A3469CB|nr:LPS export ABC transporter periplasmic protein LptC [Gilliamella sp. A7]OTQ58392.1 LPS export ABC transporter periplasmic protein LptC [Gilliamella sp. A7]